jgi:hypothetical protein
MPLAFLGEKGNRMVESLQLLSSEELGAAIAPAVETFVSRGEDYDAISEASSHLSEKGYPAAGHTPAVKFLVDATLGIVTDSDNEQRLPKEVYMRQTVASVLAQRIAELARREGVFTAYYSSDHNFDTQQIIDLITTDEKYLGALGGAPFADVRQVAGGAYKFLKRAKSLTESPQDIIKRSSDLLVVSGIDKAKAQLAENYLGLLYADLSHFWLKQRNGQSEVVFGNSSREVIKMFHKRGGGCPAGRIALAGAGKPTLLQDYWGRIVDYLLPDDATTEGFAS